ncbi:hypothetical protein OUZ56_016718 [Daphnia magna]|uniref:Transposase n=1 Tax=Daphnia magna TaxID=35525 RepID=A0ABR0ARF0_9CRUS|nr:hypothetical protein OUZ56_016718 [Daphnia magna]
MKEGLMLRSYIKKHAGNAVTEDETKGVLHRITMSGISFCKAALTGLSKSTLHRLSHKINQSDQSSYKLKRNFHRRQTFTPEKEKELALYLIVAQKLNHGLTPR